tara:strand:- start:5162 stop:5938 length:777 start_codon:yes stop_codon:yes gene_type:complete
MNTLHKGFLLIACGVSAACAAGDFTHVINIPSDPVPASSRIGGVVGETTQLNLFDTGVLPGGFLVAFGGELNVYGGTVGDNLLLDHGGVTNINGGFIGDIVLPLAGSELNINGGAFAGLIQADNAVLNITGGNLGGLVVARNGTTVNISGSDIGTDLVSDTLSIESGSMANLFVTDAVLGDGTVLDLEYGVTTVLDVRGVVLEGHFADGSAFIFDLDDNFDGFDYFPTGALTVTLVPAPAGVAVLGLGGLVGLRRRRA